MENPANQSILRRSQNLNARDPAVKWFKEWVPQDVVATGGKCFLLKWVTEDTLRALKEKPIEQDAVEPEPEPTTEVLFLCSYEGCGKTFVDAGALRKHAHVHGERQYICHYEGCGKKFLDSSKLKRHFLIHTGERDFVCPHEGCGKAFSLDFNLKSHMKTHSQENYHVCPRPDCGKRYAHEYKLRNHILSHHEKAAEDTAKYTPPSGKPSKPPKPSPAAPPHGSASSERPYGCPYEGCEKAYIHEYKLNLHLRREHPAHFLDENTRNAENEADEGSEPETQNGKQGLSNKLSKQGRQKTKPKPPPSKDSRRNDTRSGKQWTVKEEMYEEDSEETEENDEERWRYTGNNVGDDEETEYED